MRRARPPRDDDLGFDHIANLYTPTTVDACYAHHGQGPVPGIKTDEGEWNIRGHRDRIIPVDETALATFARLYDEPGTPALQARLPALHTREFLRCWRSSPTTRGGSETWREAYFAASIGTRRMPRRTARSGARPAFPAIPANGSCPAPTSSSATPLNKTPRRECTQNSHYDVVDLTDFPDDYLPRTNYVPACDSDEYRARTPRVHGLRRQAICSQKPVTDVLPARAIASMLAQSGERTLIAAIYPPQVPHTSTRVLQRLPSKIQTLVALTRRMRFSVAC